MLWSKVSGMDGGMHNAPPWQLQREQPGGSKEHPFGAGPRWLTDALSSSSLKINVPPS